MNHEIWLRFLHQVAKVCFMRFALFAPSGKRGKGMNQGICAFCKSGKSKGFALFAASGKSMNHGICTFCTKWQKRQKKESRDLRFLHLVARGKSRDLHFCTKSGKSGYYGICTKWQKRQSMNQGICTFCTKWQKYELRFALFAPSGKSMNHGICTFCSKWQKRQK